MTRGLLTFRRSLMFMATTSMIAACREPKVYTLGPRIGPPSAKIERLLLWLPADDRALDAKAVADQFRAKLSPFGVVMGVGRSTALELDRSDDQKALIASFRPTHRLEIDIMASGMSGGTSLLVSPIPWVALKAALYVGDSKTPLQTYEYDRVNRAGTKFVDKMVETLQAAGYLQ